MHRFIELLLDWIGQGDDVCIVFPDIDALDRVLADLRAQCYQLYPDAWQYGDERVYFNRRLFMITNHMPTERVALYGGLSQTTSADYQEVLDYPALMKRYAFKDDPFYQITLIHHTPSPDDERSFSS